MRHGWTESPLPEAAQRLEWPIKRAALRVHRSLGPGFREPIYRKALSYALQQQGIRSREEVWLDVEFEGLRLEEAVRADIIVEDTVILELKAVEEFHPIHRGQLLSYLKAADRPLGMLFNFNSSLILREGYDRVVHPRYLVPMTIPNDPQGRQIPDLGFPGPRVLG